ncbi:MULTISPECIES: anti-phage dCTP deaminase [unclassified Pseudoalteromonas]|uniref:anti-phage dCTP deaminase n=1 Tax=unclassified Pseudoalteromonas TaxID=194690 RepID=UPI00110B57A6|nr:MULTISPECIES: anti-phage dCTP deaminase [unclassified Pseudoalteromonas]TMP47921.1 hypothetical protein CWB80_05445 [Pseudoalteromonas sp. S1650]TMP66989.1 hypothetical protein CWB79_10105 [Pseudoalteromonas sp. S1649]
MSKQNTVSSALKTVLKESSDFIIIGLTGRTGSGCSTCAKLLSGDKLPLPSPLDSHFKGNEARKYKIVKKYIDKTWSKFEWLQVRCVLSRFVLELNYSEFCKLVSDIVKIDRQEVKTKLEDFRETYGEYHEKLVAFLGETEEDKKTHAYNIYFKMLPEFSQKLKASLGNLSISAYTTLYQKVGDNVRSSGRADRAEFDPEKVFKFPKTINKVIKAARHKATTESRPCYIVIDAIRNPYEAMYLRERYADFYLMSVNTSNENRLKHLRESHKFSDQQITELDKKEYPKKLAGHNKFISQNIQKCIENADIHINNPRADNFESSELASQLAWYVSLMMHPGLIMPTSVENCMQIAFSVKKSSGCISRQVGAAVTDEHYSIKSVGWNNTAQGQVPCILRSAEDLINGADKNAYSEYEKNDKNFREKIEFKYIDVINDADKEGMNPSFCFKDIQNEIEGEKNQVHTRSLHAEENAFLQISKYGGQKVKGGFLFTTASPCELCAKKASQLGISKIYFIDPYPGIATTHILKSGDNQPDLELFRGAVGTAFHRLYQPIMPYKDELEMAYTLPKHENKKDSRIRQLESEVTKLKLELESLKANQESR